MILTFARKIKQTGHDCIPAEWAEGLRSFVIKKKPSIIKLTDAPKSHALDRSSALGSDALPGSM